MYLKLDASGDSSPLVYVGLISADEYDPSSADVGFRCKLYDEDGGLKGCASFIISAVRGLENQFIKGRIDDKFTYWRTEEHPALDDLMYKLADLVNEGLGLK
jgi:hypothetical protein